MVVVNRTPEERRQAQLKAKGFQPYMTIKSGLDESKRFGTDIVANYRTTDDPRSPTYSDVGIFGYTVEPGDKRNNTQSQYYPGTNLKIGTDQKSFAPRNSGTFMGMSKDKYAVEQDIINQKKEIERRKTDQEYLAQERAKIKEDDLDVKIVNSPYATYGNGGGMFSAREIIEKFGSAALIKKLVQDASVSTGDTQGAREQALKYIKDYRNLKNIEAGNYVSEEDAKVLQGFQDEKAYIESQKAEENFRFGDQIQSYLNGDQTIDNAITNSQVDSGNLPESYRENIPQSGIPFQQYVPPTSQVDTSVIDSIFAGVPQDSGAAMLAPGLTGVMKEIYASNVLAGMGEMEALQSAQENSKDYVQKYKTFLEDLNTQGQGMLETNRDYAIDSAYQQKEQQLRDLDIQRDAEQSIRSRQIREAVIQQSEKEDNLLLSNGISGGWRSSMKTANVYRAISAGERKIQDMRDDMLLADRFYSSKKRDIEDRYTSSVTLAQTQFQDGLFKMFESLGEKALKADKEAGDDDSDFKLNMAKYQSKIVKEYGDLRLEQEKMIRKAQEDMQERADELRKEEYRNKKDLYSETMRYINTFGTSNKEELTRREKLLGLPSGTLSNQKTLAEIKRTGTTSNEAGTDVNTMADWIDERYNLYLSITGDPIQAQEFAMQSWYTMYPSAKQSSLRAAGELYVNNKYGTENNHVSVYRAKPLEEPDIISNPFDDL